MGLSEYHSKGNELLSHLRVSKEKPFDVSCIRLEDGTIICVAKKHIKDNVVDEIRYYEQGGAPLFVKGKPEDILKLKKEVGLQ